MPANAVPLKATARMPEKRRHNRIDLGNLKNFASLDFPQEGHFCSRMLLELNST